MNYFRLTWRLLLVGLLLVMVSLSACAQEEKPLRMVLIPGGTPLEGRDKWQPVIDYLSQELDMPVEALATTDYTTATTALKIGDADVGRLGPFSYVIAVREAGVEVIAMEVNQVTGKPNWSAYIVVRSDSGIQSIEDLKGKSFAFIDVASTSGYLSPMAMFKKRGIDPETYFSHTYFAGSHTVLIEAVRTGTVDAGGTSSNRIQLALNEKVIEEGELTIIYESEPFPSSPIVVRKGLDKELKSKIQQAWLNMPSELSLAANDVIKYVEATDSDFDYVREIARVLDLDLTKK